jgi:hypothetical protein
VARSCRYLVVPLVNDSLRRAENLGQPAGVIRISAAGEETGQSALVLHRDIFWLGKQWAVTGYGIQAINKKLEMTFDVEASRIWDEGLADALQSQPWFDHDDFICALGIARRRSREAPLTFQPAQTNERGED